MKKDMKLLGKTRRNNRRKMYKKDVLSSAFFYARNTESLSKITVFGMMIVYLFPFQLVYCFDSFFFREDEPIYTYTDKNLRHFVRQCINCGKVRPFNQKYESENSNF